MNTPATDLTPPKMANKAPKNGSEAPAAPSKEAKAPKAPKEKKAPSVSRSNFNRLYPEGAAIKVLVEKNPKKLGSKSRDRFEHYATSKTVGDFLAKGGTYGDIAYDVGRGHIEIG